jgi:uracil-DNA glycosylase
MLSPPPLEDSAQTGPDGDWLPGLAHIAPGWRPLVEGFVVSPQGRAVGQFLTARRQAGAVIYPPQPLHALQLTAPEAVRVVILGQDPYHGPGQANGLAFAVAPGVKPPPSLRNIYKELEREYGQPPHTDVPGGLLDGWAAQGVLLLNASLTVEAGQPASHARIGWQALTDGVFAHLLGSARPLVFMLWGAHAQAMRPESLSATPSRAYGRGLGRSAALQSLPMARAIGGGSRLAAHPNPHPAHLAPGPQTGSDPPAHHLWLLANHPSPLSARRPPVPFIGCGHFRAANDFLARRGEPPIDWLMRAANKNA